MIKFNPKNTYLSVALCTFVLLIIYAIDPIIMYHKINYSATNTTYPKYNYAFNNTIVSDFNM